MDQKSPKNDFFQKSKKMLLPTPEGVLHAKFEIPRSKTVTCSLWTDRQTDTQTDRRAGQATNEKPHELYQSHENG